MLLHIFIITYNRSTYLSKTLKYLSDSRLRNYDIVVLDNASTDDTKDVVKANEIVFTNLKLITHKNNIGASANFLRAIEMSYGEYTWVLCDDDFLSLNDIDDVLEILNKRMVDLIHVGAHQNSIWAKFAERIAGVKSLYDEGYHYFRFASFIPCNIFRTATFQVSCLIDGYNNIINGYPHMPFLINFFKRNDLMYISKKQLVVASETEASYNHTQLCFYWMRTCLMFNDRLLVKNAFIDQWVDKDDPTKEAIDFIFNAYGSVQLKSQKNELRKFVDDYFEADYIRYFNSKEILFQKTKKNIIIRSINNLLSKLK